jgi:hypothetical protein
MTVSSSTNRVSYAGNGSTTVFPYTYKIFDQDDLTVILRAANGTETVRAIVSDYTVSGVGSPGGGNVTMLTAPATGETLVVIRVQDLIQELDIVPNDPFSSESLEGALDRLTFMVQQHEETLGRTIKASRTNTISGAEFTISAADRANKLFAFDSSGNVNITQNVGIFRGNWAAGVAFSRIKNCCAALCLFTLCGCLGLHSAPTTAIAALTRANKVVAIVWLTSTR